MTKEIIGLATMVLLASVLIIAGTSIMSSVSDDTIEMPGYYEGLNLTSEIEKNIGTFKDITEEDSSIGIGGLVGLIKNIIFAVPKFASSLIYGIFSFFGLPIILGDIIRAIIYITYLVVGIVLLRGVLFG